MSARENHGDWDSRAVIGVIIIGSGGNGYSSSSSDNISVLEPVVVRTYALYVFPFPYCTLPLLWPASFERVGCVHVCVNIWMDGRAGFLAGDDMHGKLHKNGLQ